MSELWGGWVSAPAIVTSKAGDGGLEGTRFQWILAAAWALECSRPPPPNLLHRGDPEISMCVPCCTCVLACCALPMPAWLGHWEVSKGDTRLHRTSRAHTWSPTRALYTAQRPGRWLVHTRVCGPGREQSSRKVQACSLKSSDPTLCLSNGEQEGTEKFTSSPWAHRLWTASQHPRRKH